MTKTFSKKFGKPNLKMDCVGSPPNSVNSLFAALNNLPSRPISKGDPLPTTISQEIVSSDSDVRRVSSQSVLCMHCHGIIQERYLDQHRSSGACLRQQERRKHDAQISSL